jgi:hypothetical protein
MARIIDQQWQDYTHPCEQDNPIVAARLSPNKEFSLYPNPFSQELYLKGSAKSIVVYDLLGRPQHVQRLDPIEAPLNLSNLPLGLYILKAYNAQGQEIGQEKVLKIRQP